MNIPDSSLLLQFFGEANPELVSTSFQHPLIKHSKRAIRGRTGGAYSMHGSFPWSRAVRALALLIVKEKISSGSSRRSSDNDSLSDIPGLSGDAKSLAASLDYAIDKEPLWTSDIFGVDSDGTSLLRRLIHRTNPGRKRPGPVALALNKTQLQLDNISIEWNDRRISDAETLNRLLEALE